MDVLTGIHSGVLKCNGYSRQGDWGIPQIYEPTQGHNQASRIECVLENYFSYFSIKTYVVGTQKNCLNETVLLGTPKHMFELMGKEINAILGAQTILIRTYAHNTIYLTQQQ